MKILAERLKDLRLEKNLTQQALAQELGVSQPAIQRWEAALQIPNIQICAKIAQYFGVSLDYLAGLED